MRQDLKEAFDPEKPEFIGFVYERYKRFIENGPLPPKDQMEWECIRENITYEIDDIQTF